MPRISKDSDTSRRATSVTAQHLADLHADEFERLAEHYLADLPLPLRSLQTQFLHLALRLNSPLFLEQPLLQNSRGAIMLRKARNARFGVFDLREALVIRHDMDGELSITRPLLIPKLGGSGPESFAQFVPGEPGVSGEVQLASEGVDGSWDLVAIGKPSLIVKRSQRLSNTCSPRIDPTLLPSTSFWREQVDLAALYLASHVLREWLQHSLHELNPRYHEDLMRLRRAALPQTHAYMRALWTNVFRRMEDQLDPQVIDSFSVLQDPQIASYNFYLAGNEAPKRKRRLQALQAYPALASDFPRNESLRSIIDEGRPLNPALQANYSISAEVLRTIRGLSPKDEEAQSTLGVSELLQALSSCPKSWHPRSPEEWRAFRILVSLRLQVLVNESLPLDLRDLGPNWISTLEKVDHPLFANMSQYRNGVANLLEGSIRSVLPEGQHQLSREALVFIDSMTAKLVDRRPFLRRLAIGRSWPRWSAEVRLMLLRSRRAKKDAALSWEALTPKYFSRRLGVQVVPLTTTAALAEHGTEMGHCAAELDFKSAISNTQVVKLCTESGRSMSTAELRITPSDIEVIQHRAWKNEKPIVAASKALSEYLHWLDKDQSLVDRSRQARAARMRTPMGNRNLRVRMPTDPNLLTNLFVIYRRFFPKPFRRLRLRRFHELTGLNRIAEREIHIALGRTL